MEKEIASKYLSKENEFSYIKRGGGDHVLPKTANLPSNGEKSTSESSNSLERDTANNTASK